MFSWLHGTIRPHAGHPKRLPFSVEASNACWLPNWIGEGNHVLQFMHCSSVRLSSFILSTPCGVRVVEPGLYSASGWAPRLDSFLLSKREA